MLGAAAVIAKTVASPIDHGAKDLTLILVSALIIGAQLMRYGKALRDPQPLKRQAKRHIDRLKRAQGWEPEPKKPTTWQRLVDALILRLTPRR